MKYYLGIDINKYKIYGVVIDSNNNIILKRIISTNNKPLTQVKHLISTLSKKIEIKEIGATGDNRILVGRKIGAKVIKNKIETLSKGISNINRNIDTIIDIEDNSINLICLDDDRIDYYDIFEKSIYNEDINEVLKRVLDSKMVKGNVCILGNRDKVDKKYLGSIEIVEVEDYLLMGAYGASLLCRDNIGVK